MPMYVYRCRTCQHEFDQWAESSDIPATLYCPKCPGGEMGRVYRFGVRRRMAGGRIRRLRADDQPQAPFDPGPGGALIAGWNSRNVTIGPSYSDGFPTGIKLTNVSGKIEEAAIRNAEKGLELIDSDVDVGPVDIE